MTRHLRGLLAVLLLTLASQSVLAEDNGLITRPSAHGLQETLDRFTAAVRDSGWVLFTVLDHAAAARAAGMRLPARTLVLFGNPRAGTDAMQAHPTLAIDLPMRVLIWQDDTGQVFVTRNAGRDIATRIFARHGIAIPSEAQDQTDRFIAELVRKAAE